LAKVAKHRAGGLADGVHHDLEQGGSEGHWRFSWSVDPERRSARMDGEAKGARTIRAPVVMQSYSSRPGPGKTVFLVRATHVFAGRGIDQDALARRHEGRDHHAHAVRGDGRLVGR